MGRQGGSQRMLESMVKGRRGWWVGAALLCGLALRLWFIARFSRISGDSFIYGDFAHNWLLHRVYGFTRAGGPRATLIRLPGYPLFLGICFKLFGMDRYGPVLVVQALVDLGTCGLMAGLAGRLFGKRAWLPALWLGCLCPFTANYVAAPLTETLTLFSIALAFYALVRWVGSRSLGWLALVGVALAYSILLRPEQGLLAAAVVPAVWVLGWREGWVRALRPAVLVSVITLLPLVPWTIRNERTFHVFQPLAPRYATDPGERISYGYQRWFKTFAIDFALTETAYWPYESDTISIADLPNRAFDSDAQYAETDALLEEYDASDTSTAAMDARWAALAAERVADDPLRYYVALPLARLLNMVFRPRIDALPLPLEWWRYRLHPLKTMFCVFYGALNAGYLGLAAWGFAWRRRLPVGAFAPVVWAMVGTLVLRCAVLLTIDNSEPRYTLEFFPVLIPLGAAVVGWWFAGRRRGLDEAE